MNSKFRTALLAAGLAVALGAGLASAAIHPSTEIPVAAKSVRLPVVTNASDYLAIETRTDGVSVLNRLPRTSAN
jgi:hypothetical protein